jgi:hypothetical protein
MKLMPFVVLLACVSGCHRPADESQPVACRPGAGMPAEIDLTAYSGREMTVEAFVRACKETSGFNFTYAADTADAMKTASLRLPAQPRVAAGEFQGWLDARLAPAGFACRRVGPEHLNVLLVERRAS